MGSKRRQSSIESVDSILLRWFGKRKSETDLHHYMIRHRWAELVGINVAQRTQPLYLKNKALTVAVTNSTWLHELSFIRQSIIERINELLNKPEPVVNCIRLITAEVDPSRPLATQEAEESAYVELPPDMIEQIEQEVACIVDPDLRQAMLKARKAQLRRQLRHSKPS